jgi:hypothetical protein
MPIYLADTYTNISLLANWISVSAKYRLKSLDIGQNTGIYQPNISLGKNIGIGIGGRYVYPNISVSAKILARTIYQYWLDPYRSIPKPKTIKTKVNLRLTQYR